MSFSFLAYVADSENPGLYSVVHLPPKSPAYDLLSKMLEYVLPSKFMGTSCIPFAHDNYTKQFIEAIHVYSMHKMMTMRDFCSNYCWTFLHA